MATKRLEVVITGDHRGGARSFDVMEKKAGGLQSKLASVGKAIGKAVAVGTVALAVGTAAAASHAYDAAIESQKVSRETERVIQTTGGAAGVNAAQVAEYSGALSHLAGIDDELIQSNANLLTTFTGVRNEVGKGNDIWNQGVAIALDMATVMKTDMKAATVQVGKALNDPIRGITALSKAGVTFTEQQREQIRALTDSGDKLGAQKVIMAELQTEFGGAALAAATPLDRLKVALGNVEEEIGAALIPAVENAANWLQARLPGAIDWAKNTLDGLRPVASNVGDSLVAIGQRALPAVEDLIGAGQNLWEVLGDVAVYARPAAEGLAQIGGSVVLGAILGIAAGLEAVTGFLAENEGLVRLLIAAVAAFAAIRAWALIVTAIETLYIKWLLFRDAVTASSMRTALAQLVGAINPVTAALAAATFGGVMSFQSIQKAREEAKRWREAVEADIDLTAPHAYRDAIAEANAKYAESTKYLQDIDFQGGGFWGRVKGEVIGVVQALTPMEDTLNKSAEAQAEAADTARDLELAQIRLNRVLSLAGATLRMLPDDVRKWMVALDLNPAEMGWDEIQQAIGDASLRAKDGTPATEQLAEAYGVLSDETSTATDQLDAWKEAMDAVMGVHINYEQALLNYKNGLADLNRQIVENGDTLDINSQAGRDNRGAIAGLAQDAIDMARAFAAANGDVEGATSMLTLNRESLIATGEAAGISRGAMEAYLNSLGMTPDAVRTAVELGGIADAESQIEVTTRDRHTSIWTTVKNLVGVASDLDRTSWDRWTTFHAVAEGSAAEAALEFISRDRIARIQVQYEGRGLVDPALATAAGMADGGLVTGGIPGVDSVPKMMMPGEYVFDAATVRKLGLANLVALHHGRGPGGLQTKSMGDKWGGVDLTDMLREERRAVRPPSDDGGRPTAAGAKVAVQGGGVTINGGVEIRIDGAEKSPREIAEEVRDELLRMQQTSPWPILPGVSG